jgi:integrase
LAFFALLRVGEFTESSSKTMNWKILKLTDIQLTNSHISITVRWSKTDQHGKSVCLNIPARGTPECPVYNLSNYLKLRPSGKNENLFIHFNDKSLTRYQFSAVLRKALKFTGTTGHFRSYSFRIGGATYLYESGVTESQIMSMGRWKSEAYTRYIRSCP